MFINSEQELEDYICYNQEKFINSLKENFYEEKDIKFLGRQVEIGQENRADLIYYYDYINEYTKKIFRNIIIVELKYRKLEPKDVSQLSRYMNIFKECVKKEMIKDDNIEDINIDGVFVSFGQDKLMQEISMYLDSNCYGSDIHFMNANVEISFRSENYIHNKEYINNLKLDKRIKDLFKI